MNYEFHPEAEREFIEEAGHYESEAPGLGSRFADEVDRVIKLLRENPKIGAPVDEELRHFVLRRFPHSIVYAGSRPATLHHCRRSWEQKAGILAVTNGPLGCHLRVAM